MNLSEPRGTELRLRIVREDFTFSVTVSSAGSAPTLTAPEDSTLEVGRIVEGLQAIAALFAPVLDRFSKDGHCKAVAEQAERHATLDAITRDLGRKEGYEKGYSDAQADAAGS